MCYVLAYSRSSLFFFFFNDTATAEIYTLSLHDALPIFFSAGIYGGAVFYSRPGRTLGRFDKEAMWLLYRFFDQKSDRKSTRLNSSHQIISYAVFCLQKKKASDPV